MTHEEHSEPSTVPGLSRWDILESARQAAVASFQDRVNADPILAAQTVLDPVGMLAKFGLVQPGDNDLSMQFTKGSLTDLIHVREAVEARGLFNAVHTPAHDTEAEALRIGVEVRVCVTLRWNGVVLTVCVTVRFAR